MPRSSRRSRSATDDQRSADARARPDDSSPPLLRCTGIDAAYGKVPVLFGVDLEVAEAEVVALLGTNGAGKSTVLRVVSGLLPATGGAVIFDGADITAPRPGAARRARPRHRPRRAGHLRLADRRRQPPRRRVDPAPRPGVPRPNPASRSSSCSRSSNGCSTRRPHRCPAASSRCSPSPRPCCADPGSSSSTSCRSASRRPSSPT